MLHNITKKVYFLISVSYFCSCANQTAPTGGPQDEDPPELVGSSPRQNEKNYDKQSVELSFNEFIKTDNLKEQLIITPTSDNEYEFKIKKNKIIISFENPLDDSTTYTFNFREGIQDITESNPALGLKLAFSTGPFLDSLSITGTVKDLLTNVPSEDYTVCLYDATDTLDVFNGPPKYLTRTDETGFYQFDNIKDGQYRLYTIDDKNKNLTLQSKSEKHGFYPETIVLDSSIVGIDMEVQFLDVRDFKLQNARQSGQYFLVKFNKYALQYDLKPKDSSLNIISHFTPEHDGIRIFNTFQITDSLQVFLTAVDSIGSTLDSLFYLKFEENRRDLDPFEFRANSSRLDKNKPVLSSSITFSKPVEEATLDSIYLFLDSLNIITFDSLQDFQWNAFRDELTIEKALDRSIFQEPSKKLSAEEIDSMKNLRGPLTPTLYLKKAAFISIENDSTQEQLESISLIRAERTGIILVDVLTEFENYFIQLIDEQHNVIASETSKRQFNFVNIDPGNYRIRVLIDRDGNGQWDTGNIKKNIPAEPVYFFTTDEGNESLILRANWELGPNKLVF